METSLADIAAVTRDNNDGWCGGNGLWLFAILALMGGGFGGWNNRGYDRGAADYGTFATAASQQEILFGQRFSDLDNKIDRGFTAIGNGISDATFALNNQIGNEGRGIQMQLADCCCTTQRNTDALRFDMANYAAQNNANTTAQIQKVLDALTTNRMAEMQSQINALQLQAAMCGVVRYPNSMSYDAGTSPFCGGNGCGCGRTM